MKQGPKGEPACALLEKATLLFAAGARRTATTPASQESSLNLSVPRTWVLARADDLFSFVTSGSRGWAKYYSSEDALFIRIGNLDHETTALDLRQRQFVAPPESAEGTRTRVRPGDLLVSITGDTGMVGLVPEGLGDAYINQHIALARPAIPERHPTTGSKRTQGKPSAFRPRRE